MNNKHCRTQQQPHRRRGALLIIAMVVLIVVSTVSASIIQSSLTRHRQAKRHQNQMQAEWLAEAGLQRALFQLGKNKGYTGETWSVPQQAIITPAEAVVTITVEANKNITVVATYPQSNDYRSSIIKTVSLKE